MITLMKKLMPLLLWTPLTVGALVFSIVFYAQTPAAKVIPKVAGAETETSPFEKTNYEELIMEENQIPLLPPFEASLIARDARPKILSSFLENYSCPLIPYQQYADKYIEVADKYNLDFRLIPAISMQESNCCKRIPEGSNNCWGYGIYGDQVTTFSTVEEGIETVGKTLAKHYTSKGLMEPEEIMRKYTPQSKGSWAAGVMHFMYEMK